MPHSKDKQVWKMRLYTFEGGRKKCKFGEFKRQKGGNLGLIE